MKLRSFKPCYLIVTFLFPVFFAVEAMSHSSSIDNEYSIIEGKRKNHVHTHEKKGCIAHNIILCDFNEGCHKEWGIKKTSRMLKQIRHQHKIWNGKRRGDRHKSWKDGRCHPN